MYRTDPAVVEHFRARAARYNRSSSWADDPVLGARIVELLAPEPQHRLLDVACGTGLVSKHFRGRVAQIVGVDITDGMFSQAGAFIDELVAAPAEALPFEGSSFDRIVCRQGIQFMDDEAAVREMLRVLKPGGRVALVNLCAYGDEDRAEYFEILRLRNAARRNFYVREDLVALLEAAGAVNIEVHDYVSVENVDEWSNTGAIDESAREEIRQIYRHASSGFVDLHAASVGDQIVDHMLFGIIVGEKARQ